MQNKWKIILALGGLLLVAGAAFLAMRLLQPGGAGRLSGFSLGGAPGSLMVASAVQIERSDLLPARDADLAGQISGLADNRITLQVFQSDTISAVVTLPDSSDDKDGSVTFDDGVSGSVTREVVINQNTRIYRDVTQIGEDIGKEGGVVRQELEPMSAQDLQNGDMLSVWGEQRGDRTIAEVITVSRPVTIQVSQ